MKREAKEEREDHPTELVARVDVSEEEKENDPGSGSDSGESDLDSGDSDSGRGDSGSDSGDSEDEENCEITDSGEQEPVSLSDHHELSTLRGGRFSGRNPSAGPTPSFVAIQVFP